MENLEFFIFRKFNGFLKKNLKFLLKIIKHFAINSPVSDEQLFTLCYWLRHVEHELVVDRLRVNIRIARVVSVFDVSVKLKLISTFFEIHCR
jgi:hypothetical protein